ncbi:hypothetical protein ACOMHN_031906 [Nucella lapillus]
MASESEDDQPGRSQSSGNGSSGQGAGALLLFDMSGAFRAMARSLSTPVDVQKKAEGVLETMLAELDLQADIEVV